MNQQSKALQKSGGSFGKSLLDRGLNCMRWKAFSRFIQLVEDQSYFALAPL